MLFMPPHRMMTLGASVSGTVDGDSYDPDWLCDGDTAFPIRTPSGSASFTVTGTSIAGINGVVVAHHNLDAATTVSIGGGVTASVVTEDVPPNLIRLNALALINDVTASGCTLNISGHSGPIVIGEFFVGEFLEMRTLPPESQMGVRPFEVPQNGDFGGLSYDLGAESRTFGGTVYIDDATKKLLDDWYRACRNNSLPSVIIPIDDSAVGSPLPVVDQDPWVVKWVTYSPRPIVIDLWICDVSWQELPRYRWP